MSESGNFNERFDEEMIDKNKNKIILNLKNNLTNNEQEKIILNNHYITNKNLFLEKQNNDSSKDIFNKFSPLPKPNFSDIEKRDSNFKYKERGSYKKPKNLVPESPMKSPNQKYFTPVKIQTNLFGNNSTCRKLTFTEINESPKEEYNSNKDTNSLSEINSNLIKANESHTNNVNEENIPINEKNSSISNIMKNNSHINPNNKGNLFAKFENLKTDEMNVIDENKKIIFNPKNFYNINSDNNESKIFNNVFNNNKAINFIVNKNKNTDYEGLNDYENEDQLLVIETKEQGPSKFDSEYKILKTLESGSFGVVYKCLAIMDEKIYALKKTKKQVSKNEVSIIKNLIIDLNLLVKFNNQSNFVVNYKEAWTEEGFLIIKQEFCKYGDLLDFLQRLEKNNFKFTTNFYWDIIFQMICGLKYIHDSGYVHLDIKPSNFFVGENGILKLGDFNLTRKKNKFNDDYFEGDSTYMAPEILEATKIKDINDKCDIFSLGLTIIEILFKIELPQNGILWRQIRNINFSIPDEFLSNSNLKNDQKQFFELIYGMIHFDPKKRFDINYLLEEIPELKSRMENLKINSFKTSYENFIFKFDQKLEVANFISCVKNSNI